MHSSIFIAIKITFGRRRDAILIDSDRVMDRLRKSESPAKVSLEIVAVLNGCANYPSRFNNELRRTFSLKVSWQARCSSSPCLEETWWKKRRIIGNFSHAILRRPTISYPVFVVGNICKKLYIIRSALSFALCANITGDTKTTILYRALLLRHELLVTSGDRDIQISSQSDIHIFEHADDTQIHIMRNYATHR